MLVAALLSVVLAVCVQSARNDSIQQYADASNFFAFNLLQRLPYRESHVFVSPFSVSVAMAMVYDGAAGISERQLYEVLGYQEAGLAGKANVLSRLQQILRSESAMSDGVTLEAANAVLVKKDYPIVERYKSDLQGVFNARIEEVDFFNDNAAAIADINRWVSEKTRGQISDAVERLPGDTVMFIMNAVYFKGDWQVEFDQSKTSLLPFYNNGETSTLVETMLSHDRYRYASDNHLHADIVELPYKGKDFSMVVLLPHERDGLVHLVEALTASAFHAALGRLTLAEVKLKFPKFKLQSKYSLVEPLSFLGATSIFGSGADLSGISGRKDLYVSDVLHKAVIEVNEKGSEASAFTGVIVRPLSASHPDPLPVEMHVDHPFAFCIRDAKTGLILFLGVVNEL
ncbi:intracellular coagulation inhibitor 2-like [Ornithodoros turicata]|uniref:intracellular coagulation inhibitor 2-like n=1 Tax=Ornithodoros turicata TaxID=34597 RepID=UPI0031387389